MSELKSYSDTYLYSKYPLYSKLLLDAIVKDPIMDKSDNKFKDVIYDIKHAKVSDALVRILNSTNVVLLDCDKPLPRSFKVFAAKDVRDKKNPMKLKIFIDTSFVIEPDSKGQGYNVDEIKLISYLVNAATTMIYHKSINTIISNNEMVMEACKCFSKAFTFIIDYLAKVSIQESNKIKVMYLSSMYFLMGLLGFENEERARTIAKKVAEISEQEAHITDILLEKVCSDNGNIRNSDANPYDNIKVFVNCMRDTLHINKNTVSVDIVIERWMRQYGPGTVFGLEYFPTFSAMITDAYVGGFLNQQKSIEKVCGTDMVLYTKSVLSALDRIV